MPESLLVSPDLAAALKAEAKDIPVHDLTPEETDWVELLLRGVVSKEHVGAVTASLEEQRLALRDAEGVILAIAERVDSDWRLSGLELPTRYDAVPYRSGPGAWLDDGKLWGVFCREALHRGAVERLNELLAGSESDRIFLFVPASTAESGDFPHLAQLRLICAAAKHLPAARVKVVVVPFPGNLDEKDRILLEDRILAGYGCASLAAEWTDWRAAVQKEAGNVAELAKSESPLAVDASYSNVLEELQTSTPPASRRGFTVFFTGLSGSGKSTVARHLQVKLLEHGGRDVSLLDGDLVRKHLSSELGFSKEHRDLNIRRIGYVASEVTKHGGAAVCCPIAPYDATRKAVRGMIEEVGGFILVHISTPVEVCEARDRKGLYAKARAGIIKEFTGISDPYEIPEDADIAIDTGEVSADDAAEQVMTLLEERGYLS